MPVPLTFHAAVAALLDVFLTAVCQQPGPILELMDSVVAYSSERSRAAATGPSFDETLMTSLVLPGCALLRGH